jgi:hypothetical protein
MKITKQRLKEIIKEELESLNEVDRGEWVIERDGVTADEKYLSRGLKWGPQNRAEVHEFKQEAQGVLRYALESGKIDSGRVSAVMNEDADDDNDFEKDQATIDGDADGAAGVPPKPPHGFAERYYMQAYKHAFNRTAGERAKKSRQGLKRRDSDLERKKQLRYKN